MRTVLVIWNACAWRHWGQMSMTVSWCGISSIWDSFRPRAPRVTHGWGWKAPLEPACSSPSAQAGCPGACPDGFCTAPRMDTAQPTPLGSRATAQSPSPETDELHWKEAQSRFCATFFINAFCVSGCCGSFSVMNYEGFPWLRAVPYWLWALGLAERSVGKYSMWVMNVCFINLV